MEKLFMRKRIEEPLRFSPLQIEVEHGCFDDACKRFKALFQKERIIGQLKERSFYEKPSDKKRRKQRETRERKMLLEMREKMLKSGELERKFKRKQRKREEKLRRRLMRLNSDIDNTEAK